MKLLATLWLGFVLVGCGAIVSEQAVNSGSAKVKLSPSGLFMVKNAQVPQGKVESATFGAGCFWGVEEEFRKTKGVIATAVGFSGGHVKNPSYPQVCRDTTGHAEVVQVEFDPSVVTYDQLLKLFWDIHDPTQVNRQGPDYGSQYRSIVFYRSEAQQKAAMASRDKLQASGELDGKVVTEIVPFQAFYKAEDYHQQYVEKGGIAYCHRRKP